MSDWANFFIAQAGASAALTGLIFVAVSINLNRILALPRLPHRAFEALVILLTILILSSLLLVPHISVERVGIEILIVGLIIWGTVTIYDIRIIRKTDPQYRQRFLMNMVLSQFSTLPYVIAGVLLISQGEDGLYWIVAGVIFSFIKALLDAWVLLVEINR